MEFLLTIISLSGFTVCSIIGIPTLIVGLNTKNTQMIITGILFLIPIIVIWGAIFICGIFRKKPYIIIMGCVVLSVFSGFIPIKNEISQIVIMFLPMIYSIYLLVKIMAKKQKNKNYKISDLFLGNIQLD